MIQQYIFRFAEVLSKYFLRALSGFSYLLGVLSHEKSAFYLLTKGAVFNDVFRFRET